MSVITWVDSLWNDLPSAWPFRLLSTAFIAIVIKSIYFAAGHSLSLFLQLFQALRTSKGNWVSTQCSQNIRNLAIHCVWCYFFTTSSLSCLHLSCFFKWSCEFKCGNRMQRETRIPRRTSAIVSKSKCIVTL